jgi:hypothetical protein
LIGQRNSWVNNVANPRTAKALRNAKEVSDFANFALPVVYLLKLQIKVFSQLDVYSGEDAVRTLDADFGFAHGGGFSLKTEEGEIGFFADDGGYAGGVGNMEVFFGSDGLDGGKIEVGDDEEGLALCGKEMADAA